MSSVSSFSVYIECHTAAGQVHQGYVSKGHVNRDDAQFQVDTLMENIARHTVSYIAIFPDDGTKWEIFIPSSILENSVIYFKVVEIY
jgi:hypothetical protein